MAWGNTKQGGLRGGPEVSIGQFEEVAHAQSLQEGGLDPKREEEEDTRNEGTRKSKQRAAKKSKRKSRH